MKKLMLGAIVLLMTATSFAQGKVGTVDVDFVISKMPELTGANEAVKAYNLDLEGQLKAKLADYDTKIKAYKEGVKTFTEEEAKLRQEEILTAENDISKFRQNGAQLLQLKQNEVTQPLYKKIGEVVAQVAKEQGYTQVLTIGNNNNLAYADPTYDITLAVIKKMGITLKEGE